MSLEFTGEFWIPGRTSKRIEADHRERYRFAGGFVSGKKVLDVACGVGAGARILLEAGARSVHGVDISARVIEYARSTYQTDGLSFTVGDLCALDLGESYEVATCFETIEHVPDHRLAIRNLHRAIRPGGVLLISSPNRAITSPRARALEDKPENRFHVREFLVEELRAALEEHGFSVRASGIYGQRNRPRFSSRLLARLHRKLLRPDQWGSATPRPLGNRVARYFLLVADRPQTKTPDQGPGDPVC